MRNPSGPGVEGRTAVASSATNVSERKDPVAVVSDVLNLPPGVLPALIDGGAVLRPGIGSLVAHTFNGGPNGDDLRVTREQRIERRAVTSVEGFTRDAHKLHVLLRHRLLLQPELGESLVPCKKRLNGHELAVAKHKVKCELLI